MAKKINLNELRNLVRQVINEGTPTFNKTWQDFKEWLEKLPERGESDIEIDNFELLYPNEDGLSNKIEFHLIGFIEIYNRTIRFLPNKDFKVSRIFQGDSKSHDISKFSYGFQRIIIQEYKNTFKVNPGEYIYATTSNFDKATMGEALLWAVYQEYYLPNIAKINKSVIDKELKDETDFWNKQSRQDAMRGVPTDFSYMGENYRIKNKKK
jgi:hypothetical protein